MNDDADDFLEVSGNAEDELDFGSISTGEISAVAIATTDWTTETVLSQLTKRNIQLNPSFQRRDAWEPKRKSQFIESLILGLPVPQIVLAERHEQKGTYVVLDGKQRLLCLRQFMAKNDDPDFKPFKLSNLIVRKDLNGRAFSDLTEDLHFRREVSSLENFAIRAVLLRNWRSEKLLGHIFLRLNMGSKSLSPQELRQALHPGPFLEFADEYSIKSIAIQDILGRTTPDFRMRDVEILIRYLSFRHFLAQYRGDMKEFLDVACLRFNTNWDVMRVQLEKEVSELDDCHHLVRKAFGSDYKYGKWQSDRFEVRFNRAVFDVLVHSLLIAGVHKAVENEPSIFVEAFKNICDSDSHFIEAIERTTKSIEATRYRLTSWFAAVAAAYNIQVPQPIVG